MYCILGRRGFVCFECPALLIPPDSLTWVSHKATKRTTCLACYFCDLDSYNNPAPQDSLIHYQSMHFFPVIVFR